VAEIHIKRGYLDVAAELIRKVIKRETLSGELLTDFNILLELARQYEQKKSYQEAIFWYKQYYLMYSKASIDTRINEYIKEIKLCRPTEIRQSTFDKIKELRVANIELMRQKIININNPAITCNEETSLVFVKNYKRENVIVILKNYELSFAEEGDQFLIQINGEDTRTLLSAIHDINKKFQEAQKAKNKEPEEIEIYAQKQIVEPIPTQLKVIASDAEQTIISDTSEQLPSQSTRKNSKKQKNKVCCHNSADNDQNAKKIKMTAEQLGFDLKYNRYRIVSFYNQYVPEGIHYGFFDSTEAKKKKVDHETLDKHAKLLYESRVIVSHKESGIVPGKKTFKTKSSDNFRMWARREEEITTTDGKKRILWNFCEPVTHNSQTRIYKRLS
jgi:hypothetical protein